MIIKLDGGHVVMPTPHATDLVDLLDKVAEVLRYGCDDLFEDTQGDLFTSCQNDRLIETVEHHASTLRKATRSSSCRRTIP